MKRVEYNYRKAVDGLQDLSQIDIETDRFSRDIINQINFHIFELYSNLKASEKLVTQEYPNLIHQLDDKLEKILKNLLLKNNFSQLQVAKNINNWSFGKWDKILATIEMFLSTVNSFIPNSTASPIKIYFSDDSVNVSFLTRPGALDPMDSVTRQEIIRSTKKLLAQEALLLHSFNYSLQMHEEQLIECNFTLDISHHLDQIYFIDLSEFKMPPMAFPSLFEKYKITDKNSLKNRKHTCIEITKHLSLKRYDFIPTELDEQKTIIHLPFLFHSISLIIPIGGKLVPTTDLPAFDIEQGRQDVNFFSNKRSCNYLDFFSLFSF